MKKTIVSVVGNRPQFVKMAPVSRALKAAGVDEIVVHTGQHYDDKLSDIFFRELGLKKPDIQLEVSGRTHGAMTGELLAKLEAVFMEKKPGHVLLYGDTNTTLAAALAAAKLHIPIAHIEGGPRLYDRSMPEEINRVVVDHLSALIFCPDGASVENLKKEGITSGVHQSGDVMLDAFHLFRAQAKSSPLLKTLPDAFILTTLHRPANVDSAECLKKIAALIGSVPVPVLFPVHPRTRQRLKETGLEKDFASLKNLRMTEPLGYLDTLAALIACQSVLTDSGGLQKEAYFAGKTSVVLLDETPWPDLKASGWQFVAGGVPKMKNAEVLAKLSMPKPKSAPNFYGDGKAAQMIVQQLEANGFFS